MCGGPAFPRPTTTYKDWEDGTSFDVTQEGHSGMTLLDYFAGQALAGRLAAEGKTAADESGYPSFADIAMDAYGIAEAMIAERKRIASS
jgi:hypothetical protein